MHFLRNVSCRSLTPNVSFELANSDVTPCQPGSCVTAANSRYFYQHVSYVNKGCIFAALFFSLLLPGLHVFLERLYFFRSPRVYAGRTGPEREATARALRCEEKRPAFKEGEKMWSSHYPVFRLPVLKCSWHPSLVVSVCRGMHCSVGISKV